MQKTGEQSKTITSLTCGQLAQAFAEMGQPAYRAKQVFTWLNKNNCTNFEQMTNLPKTLRQTLAQTWQTDSTRLVKTQLSESDGTAKLLLEFKDKNQVETVLMQYSHGFSVCVSSQVGCRMACQFCASANLGFVRGLSAGEMAAQVAAAAIQAKKPVSNVVLMGICEPLDNFENVIDFISIISHPDGLNIAGRNISLSTCGLVPQIYMLANLLLPLTLSVSLHATTNALRSQLMPINKKWPIEQLMMACKDYRKATGRRISFEYALMDAINDSPEDAQRLAKLLLHTDAHVNLIFANKVAGSVYSPSTGHKMQQFKNNLERAGVQVTVRRRLGANINAACGQLKANEQKRQNTAFGEANSETKRKN